MDYIPWRAFLVGLAAMAGVGIVAAAVLALGAIGMGGGWWQLGDLFSTASRIWYIPWDAVRVCLGMFVATGMFKLVVWGIRFAVRAADGMVTEEGAA